MKTVPNSSKTNVGTLLRQTVIVGEKACLKWKVFDSLQMNKEEHCLQ